VIAPARRPYLDWLRGLAVLLMIEGHTLDAWTRLADRDRAVYGGLTILNGFGAPAFLFLAGVALALAAGSRRRKGLTDPEVVAAALRRGLWIFGLAFLFRLQALVISGGAFPEALLKVDILNVMGLSMIAGALLWRAGWSGPSRGALCAGAAALAAMLTPLVRASDWLTPLADPLEWYLRPAPGSTTFTLLPWGGFLLAGAAIGVWLDGARTDRAERRVNLALLVVGAALGLGGYGAAFLPPLYAETTFWTGSPTFFFLRLGILIALVPVAYAWTMVWPGAAVREFGRASLFVYWIHVEMAYGALSAPIHRQLSFEQWLLAFALFTVFLFGLVRLKERVMAHGRSPNSELAGKSDAPASA
jgi:uncharacterized membrane protein